MMQETQGDNENKKCSKRQKVCWAIPVLAFLAFISCMMIGSISDEVMEEIGTTRLSVSSMRELSDSFDGVLEESAFRRENYIDLNGLVTKALGINSLNERQRLRNGYLVGFEETDEAAVLSCAENVIEVNAFLEERDIDFVYLLAPSKAAFYDVEFAPGYETDAWKGVDEMMGALGQSEVTTIDMDTWFEENGWTTEDVYYKTDSHWRPQAAMAAARETMALLSEQGLAEYDESLLQEESYSVLTLEHWFLGNAGQRVGRFYAGVDDMEVYLPDFTTDYMCAFLSTGTTDWTYTDNPLNLWYLDNKDYYNTDPYGVYLYGNYPQQVVTNSAAPNAKRLLVMGDSFRRPWEYFLTTQFQEIYYIDLRNYSDGTFAQYVEEIQPDLVIMCTQSTDHLDEFYLFGTEEYRAALDATSVAGADIAIQENAAIEAQETNADNLVVLCDNLEPGQTYTLTVDSTAYSGGEDQFVQMTLQDLSDNTAVYNRYFEANSGETQKWIFTTPEDESGSYSIYLYAGTRGHTAGASAEVTGVTLRQGIFEE